jgi:hypothetical protein
VQESIPAPRVESLEIPFSIPYAKLHNGHPLRSNPVMPEAAMAIHAQEFEGLFDALPNVVIFVKDERGR